MRWKQPGTAPSASAAPADAGSGTQPRTGPPDDGKLSALVDGLDALERGEWHAAETSLRQAASVVWVLDRPLVTVAIAPGVEASLPAGSDAATHALVEVLQRQGRLDEALGLLETMEPTELVAVSAAELLLETDRASQVVEDFAELRTVDTAAGQCLNVLVAVAAERVGDIGGADARLRAVLAADDLADEVAAEALAVRAGLAQRVGRDQVAQACRRKLARLDPDHPALNGTAGVGVAVSAEGLAELRARVAELTDLVVERETDLADRRSRLDVFIRRFTSRAGRLIVEVDQLRAHLAAARAAASPQDRAAREAAEQARVRAEQSAQACADADEDGQAAAVDDEAVLAPPSEELSALWRKAARMMHPDATTDESEKQARHDFFTRLEQAYRNRDIDEVRRVMQQFEQRPEAVEGDSIAATAERLRRTVVQLEDHLVQLERQIGQLTDDPMWALMLRVTDAEEQGRDLLTEMHDDLQVQRDELADDLLTLEAL